MAGTYVGIAVNPDRDTDAILALPVLPKPDARPVAGVDALNLPLLGLLRQVRERRLDLAGELHARKLLVEPVRAEPDPVALVQHARRHVRVGRDLDVLSQEPPRRVRVLPMLLARLAADGRHREPPAVRLEPHEPCESPVQNAG